MKPRFSSPSLALAAFLALAGLGRESAAACTLPEPPLCAPLLPVSFRVECEGGAGLLHSFDFGDGSPATPFTGSPAASHAFAAPGLYTVVARVRDADGVYRFASAVQKVGHPKAAGKAASSSSLLFLEGRAEAWTANEDNHTLGVVSLRGRKLLAEIPVGRGPVSLAFAPPQVSAPAGEERDKGSVWILLRDEAGLAVVGAESRRVLRRIALPRGSRPQGLVLDEARRLAYLSLEGTGRIVKVSLDAPPPAIPPGEGLAFPGARALALAQDGKDLYVTRFISPSPATSSGGASSALPGPASGQGEVARVSLPSFSLAEVHALAFDTTGDSQLGGRGLPNALAAAAMSPDGRHVFVAGKKDNIARGLLRDGQKLSHDNSVRSLFMAIDRRKGAEDLLLRRDLDNRGLPTALHFGHRGELLFVALGASNAVDIHSALSGNKIAAISPATPDRELFPKALLTDAKDSLLLIHYAHSREVGLYDVSRAGGDNRIDRLALLPTVFRDSLTPQLLLGKQIFHNAADPRMGNESYISCGVCHLDGLDDGRVWDFTEKGEGLRRTTRLLGNQGLLNGPLHWSANFDEVQDFEHDLRSAFGGKGFLSEAQFSTGGRDNALGGKKAGQSPELDALAAYVASLARALPSPYRNSDGTLTTAAREGKKIFERADVGCALCHAGPAFTDSRFGAPGFAAAAPGMGASALPAPAFRPASFRTPEGFLLHDVGTLKPSSGRRRGDSLQGLDTPSLTGLFLGGPYLHDGAAGSLLDVITVANPQDKHGRTSHLSPAEKEHLVAYLLQIEEAEGASPVRDAKGRPSARAGAGSGGAWAPGKVWTKSGFGFHEGRGAPDPRAVRQGLDGGGTGPASSKGREDGQGPDDRGMGRNGRDPSAAPGEKILLRDAQGKRRP